MGGKAGNDGISMKRGAEMALKEIQRQGKLKNIELQLLIHDDQSDYSSKYGPIEIARKISQNKKVLAVIGHKFSVPTIAAAPIYAKHQIPLISPTATAPEATAVSEWAFSMICNDLYQSRFLANYVVHALNKKRIAIIHSEDGYGKSLKTHFIRELQKNKVIPHTVIELPEKDMEPVHLKVHLEHLKKADIIFLAMLSDNAANVLKYLKNKQVQTDFIGNEVLGNPKFIHDAGVYSENVYAVTSFLQNLLGIDARLYAQQYRKTYLKEPDWISSHSYEAVQLIANAIEKVGPDRFSIKDYLKQIRSPHESVKGIGGNIYFDRYGSNQRAIYIGQVKNGRFISSEFQLIQAPYPELLPAGEQKELVHFYKQALKRTTIVFTGVHIKEIKEINIDESYYTADFNLWFRWNGKDEKNLDFELLNGQIENQAILEKYENPETGEHFISYEIKATLKEEFPLHDYPFDKQILGIQVKPLKAPTTEILLVADLDESEGFLPIDLGIWRESLHLQYVDLKEFLYSFRNPQFDQKMYTLDYSLFHYEIRMAREVSDYLLKMIPLLFMLIIVGISFFMDITRNSGARFDIGLLGLLTAVAFHQTVISVGYLIRADFFFICTYFLISLIIVETVIVDHFYHSQREKLALAIDRYSFSGFVMIIVGLAIALFGDFI